MRRPPSIACPCTVAQKDDLLRMEMICLDNFDWRLKTPTAYSLLHLLCQGMRTRLAPAVTATAAYLTVREEDREAWKRGACACSRIRGCGRWRGR